MKTYKSHKTVEAAKILEVHLAHHDGGAILALEGEMAAAIHEKVPAGWLANHSPLPTDALVGGYFVRYADGYTSWSPAAAFEEGYTELVHDPKDGALPVAGYKPQNQVAVDCVNAMKSREEMILRQLDFMREDAEVDQRWLATGRTHLELAFMAINRSIFRPGRVEFPEEVGETAPGAASLINRISPVEDEDDWRAREQAERAEDRGHQLNVAALQAAMGVVAPGGGKPDDVLRAASAFRAFLSGVTERADPAPQ